MGEWIRIIFWFIVGVIIGLSCSALFAHADETWSNYPRLPKAEMTLYDDGSWGLQYGGVWWPKQVTYAPPRITSGHWYNYNPHINICQDSTLIPRSISPEFGISGVEHLIIRDTTFSGWDTNVGIEWEMIDSVWVTGDWDTLGTGRYIDMIQGAIQFVVGVRPDGFCAHRVMRFYLEPHADRLAYQP